MSTTKENLLKGDQRKPDIKSEKTVLLVGGDETDKSTLLDTFLNHIIGVNWGDPFRFTTMHLNEDMVIIFLRLLCNV